MSLDIGTFCPCCHSSMSDQNITYNVGPIYYRAIRAVGLGRQGLRSLHGRRLGDVIDQIRQAKAFLTKYHDRLVQYEPDNGWGSIECVHRVFDSLILSHDGQDPKDVGIYEYALPGRPWLLIDCEGPWPEVKDPLALEKRVERLEQALLHTYPGGDLEKILSSIEGAVT